MLFKDLGTDEDYTAWTYTNNVTISRASETTITQTDTASMANMFQTLSVTDGFCVEFDVQATYYNSFTLVNFRQGSSGKLNLGASYLCGDSEWHHLKICVNGLNVTVSRDGVDLTPQTLSASINRIYLQVGNAAIVQYKNFMIYQG